MIEQRLSFSPSPRLRAVSDQTEEVRAIPIHPIVKDIFDRRLRLAPKSLVTKVFGFDAFGLRIWKSQRLLLMAAGRTTFLRQADEHFHSHRRPFPGLIGLRADYSSIGFLIDESIMNVVQKSSIEGFECGIVLRGRSSILLSQTSVKNRFVDPYHIDLVIACCSEAVSIEDFKDEIEIMLSRQLSSGR